MRKYSVNEYKQFLDDFTNENKSYRAFIYREIFWNEDLFSMNAIEMKEFLVDKVLEKSNSLKYLKNIRLALVKFFEWCKDKDIIAYNVWKSDDENESELYDYSIFAEYMLSKIKVKIYYPEDIERIINRIREDKPLFEMIIRGFYEGIESHIDFARLKKSDINLDENWILYNGRQKNISQELSNAIRDYINYVGLSDIYKHEENGDFLLRTRTTNSNEEMFIENLTGRIRDYLIKVSDMCGEEINYYDLVASGFVNYVKQKCKAANKDNKYFVNVFAVGVCGGNKRFEGKIAKFAEEYGFKKNPSSIFRQKYYPYARIFRYSD